jgi:flagellar hook-associated protein 2
VAGSIGGIAATGSGQTLTGAGDASGLTLTVTGGATGNRGTVKFAQGYAVQLDQMLTGLLASDGTLAARTDGINSSIISIGNQRAALNLRLAAVQARYQAQYTALDMLMSKLNSTSSYLTQQLANLSGSSSTK